MVRGRRKGRLSVFFVQTLLKQELGLGEGWSYVSSATTGPEKWCPHGSKPGGLQNLLSALSDEDGFFCNGLFIIIFILLIIGLGFRIWGGLDPQSIQIPRGYVDRFTCR